MSSLKLITQDKAEKETLGAADSASKPPSYDAVGPGGKSGSGVGQEDAVHRHPGTVVGSDEGQWRSGAGARPGDASYRRPGSGTGQEPRSTGQPSIGTRRPDSGYPPGGGPGQDDAVHQYSGPGLGPDKGEWHSGGGARPGEASYRQPGAGAGGDSGTDRGDPHSRLSGTAPLATGEDLSGGSRPTDIDEAIARASAGGPLGAAGGVGSDLPDAVGAGGGGGDRPYTRIRQAENVKPILQVLCLIRVHPNFFFISVVILSRGMCDSLCSM